MVKREPGGVQELALETQHTGHAVVAVTAHRQPDRAQVHADLVGAPGLEAQAQQRGARIRSLEREMGASLARARAANRHPRARARVAPDGGLDRAASGGRASLYEGEVFALDQPACEGGL